MRKGYIGRSKLRYITTKAPSPCTCGGRTSKKDSSNRNSIDGDIIDGDVKINVLLGAAVRAWSNVDDSARRRQRQSGAEEGAGIRLCALLFL